VRGAPRTAPATHDGDAHPDTAPATRDGGAHPDTAPAARDGGAHPDTAPAAHNGGAQAERPPQMSHPVKGVDHVFLLVNDLDQSCDAYAALGFTISPRGMHSAHKGAANHTIMLQTDYFELLGLIAAVPGNADRRQSLADMGQGLHAIACRIEDAHAAKAALADLGIATEDVGSFSRPLPLPGGGEGMASFDTLQFEPGIAPLGACFMCRHKTREMVWRPELMAHANGAVALGAIVAETPDPDAAAAGYARLFAAGAVSAIPGGAALTTGADSAPILFMTPAALADAYPTDLSGLPRGAFAALRILTRDMDAARRAVGGAPIFDTAAGFAVAASAACGTIVEFAPA
jgi:catechol 2,3-dioxygenase-like lactoylglutathione lyase family enzyme